VVLQIYLHHKLEHQVVQVAAEVVKEVQLVELEQHVKEMLVVQVMHLKVVQNEVVVVVAQVVLASQEHQDLQIQMVETV
jgi:hypothetical protein|tara:strand:- start:254 stop:490 length:237 start_codon:yes stop_codon:yes gene_type:complete